MTGTVADWTVEGASELMVDHYLSRSNRQEDESLNEVQARLVAAFRWRSDPPAWPDQARYYADDSSWWRDADILQGLGPALASLCPGTAPTVVLGTESRGSLLGSLVATHLGVGFAEVRKAPERASDDDKWWTQRTTPDYRDRHLELAVRRSVLGPGDRVLFVDDWAATGGQALACQRLAIQAQALWVGAAVVVDGLESSAQRRGLALRGLLHLRDLASR